MLTQHPLSCRCENDARVFWMLGWVTCDSCVPWTEFAGRCVYLCSTYLPLLICRGDWWRCSDSSCLSGERDRPLPWDRLEWSDVSECISEMSAKFESRLALKDLYKLRPIYTNSNSFSNATLANIATCLTHHLCLSYWLMGCCHQGQECWVAWHVHLSAPPSLACPLTFQSASWHLSKTGSL